MTLLMLAGCSPTPEASPPQEDSAPTTVEQILTKPEAGVDLLFIARAKNATLTLDKAGKGTLVMEDVETMTWFSDRPAHDAGTSTTADVLDTFGWERDGDSLDGGKPDNAPNAALTADNLTDTIVVELLTATRDGERLTFTVADVAKKPGPARDVELVNSDLFIDSVLIADGGGFVLSSFGFSGVVSPGTFRGGDMLFAVGGLAYVDNRGRPSATTVLMIGGLGPAARSYTLTAHEGQPDDLHGLRVTPNTARLTSMDLVPGTYASDGSPVYGYLVVKGILANGQPFEKRLKGEVSPCSWCPTLEEHSGG